MKYQIGQKVKINKEVDLTTSSAVVEANKSYPNSLFTIESSYVKPDRRNIKIVTYYTVVAEQGTKAQTYRYEIKEDYLISLEELREEIINSIIN